MDFKLCREIWTELVLYLEKKLTELEQLDVSEWDEFNLENYERAKASIKSAIKHWQGMLDLLPPDV